MLLKVNYVDVGGDTPLTFR